MFGSPSTLRACRVRNIRHFSVRMALTESGTIRGCSCRKLPLTTLHMSQSASGPTVRIDDDELLHTIGTSPDQIGVGAPEASGSSTRINTTCVSDAGDQRRPLCTRM